MRGGPTDDKSLSNWSSESPGGEGKAKAKAAAAGWGATRRLLDELQEAMSSSKTFAGDAKEAGPLEMKAKEREGVRRGESAGRCALPFDLRDSPLSRWRRCALSLGLAGAGGSRIASLRSRRAFFCLEAPHSLFSKRVDGRRVQVAITNTHLQRSRQN